MPKICALSELFIKKIKRNISFLQAASGSRGWPLLGSLAVETDIEMDADVNI